MSNGLKLGLGLGRGKPGVPPVYLVSITGLENGEARPGSHASIGFTTAPPGGTVTQKWGSTLGGDQFGTGASPTDFTSADGGTLHLEVTRDSVVVRRTAPIRYAPGAAPSISAQNWTVDDTTVNLAAAATGTGLTFSYEAAGLPAGVTINASTGQITGTPTAASSGTVNVTATDQYGRTVSYSFGYTNALRAQATAANGIAAQNWTVDDTSVNLNAATDFTAGGNTLTYSASGLPAGTSISTLGVITGTPTAVSSGNIVVTGTDEYGRQTTSTIAYTTALRSIATATADSVAWTEGVEITPYDITQNFTLNGNSGSFGVTGLPVDLSVVSDEVVGTPEINGLGEFTITFTDTYARETTSIVAWAISELSTAPILTAGDPFIDDDNDRVNFSIDKAATVYWARYADGSTPTASQIRDGVGAIEAGSFAVSSGVVDQQINFASGNDGLQVLAIVAQVSETDPLSNVLSGAITIITTWSITDNGDGTFTIAGAPATPAALFATDNGDGTFTLTE